MALSDTTTKIIRERLDALPPAIKTLLGGSYIDEAIAGLAEEFTLHDSLALQIHNEVALVLLCFVPPSELEVRLKTILKNFNPNVIEQIKQRLHSEIIDLVKTDISAVWEDIASTESDAQNSEPMDQPNAGVGNTLNKPEPNLNPINQTSNKPVQNQVMPQTEEVERQKQTNPTLMTKQREDLLKEIEEAEEKLASISPIRTMQTDYQQTKESDGPIEAEPEREVEEIQPTEPVSQSSSQEELLNKKKSQYADLRPQDSNDLKWDSDNS